MTATTGARAPPFVLDATPRRDTDRTTSQRDRDMSLTTYPDPAPAVVIEYRPPTALNLGGSVTVRCPYCRQADRWRRPTERPGEHVHGTGAANEGAAMGSRVAHCASGARSYVLADPAGLVPEVNPAPKVVTA